MNARSLRTFLAIAVAAALAAANLPGGAGAATFTNPLLPGGADPWVTSRDGYYYYMNTTGSNLTIWKTRDITDLKDAQKEVVWTPPQSGPDSHDIWAPELHFLDGKWYIYFAADAGSNESHRIFVLENSSPDPLSTNWVYKGELSLPDGKWAIDASVFEDAGKLYAIWSGWEGDRDGEQDIYIARLENPWTATEPRVRISRPKFDWEQAGGPPFVNEGPEILEHAGKIFLVFSASGCWTDNYALGMLSASAGSNLLNPKSWKKTRHPVLSESPAAQAFGTGHNTFFKSPDGTQDWILYHANPETNKGCREFRSPRAQPFTWKANGTPDFGKPVPLNTPLEKPSGTSP